MAAPKKAIWPWMPAEYGPADVAALKAVRRGEASPDQQIRAMEYIVGTICKKDDMSFRPGGEEGRRASDFAEGKRHVGLQIVKLTNVQLNKDPTK